MNESSPHVFDIPIIRPRGGPKTSLTANLRTLERSIKELRFTPIIGTESSVIGRESTLSWQRMSDEMRGSLSGLEDTAERNYLSSLIREKRVSDVTVPDIAPVTDELASLRKELVRLASKATEIFAHGMVDSAVSDIAACKVHVSHERDIAAVNERLVRACLAALEQMKTIHEPDKPGVRIGLDETDIYSRLLDLTYKFMGGQIPPVTEELFSILLSSGKKNRDYVNEVHRDLENRSVTRDCRHQLFLHQLEWLADLIFHSFSFDGRFYPTNDELSFHAALHIDESDQRPSSVNVFEKGGDALVEIIPAWFKRYNEDAASTSSQMKDFYDALALILLKQDKYWHSNVQKLRREPVAFSLNLDLEMEKALERSGVGRYYVALPVQPTTLPRQDFEEHIHQRWLLAKFFKERKYKEPAWAWYSDDITMDGEIDGPVVVKLHGSPLHRLPIPVSQEEFDEKSKGRKDPSTEYIATPSPEVGYSSLKPFVTLSESGYLHNIVVIRNIPKFFEDIFKDKNRHFYFLGLSTSEWNIRLRMSDLVFPGFPGRRYYPDRVMVAINKEFDDYCSSILDSLGIQRWEGALEGFTLHLLHYARGLP